MLARAQKLVFWGVVGWESLAWSSGLGCAIEQFFGRVLIEFHQFKRQKFIEERQQPGAVLSPEDAELMSPDGQFDQRALPMANGTFISLNDLKEECNKFFSRMRESLRFSLILFMYDSL